MKEQKKASVPELRKVLLRDKCRQETSNLKEIVFRAIENKGDLYFRQRVTFIESPPQIYSNFGEGAEEDSSDPKYSDLTGSSRVLYRRI